VTRPLPGPLYRSFLTVNSRRAGRSIERAFDKSLGGAPTATVSGLLLTYEGFGVHCRLLFRERDAACAEQKAAFRRRPV
jgi:hypothetical protein